MLPRLTGQVFALCGQVSGNVFWEMKGDPHTAMLRASELRCQPPRLGGLRSNRRRQQGPPFTVERARLRAACPRARSIDLTTPTSVMFR